MELLQSRATVAAVLVISLTSSLIASSATTPEPVTSFLGKELTPASLPEDVAGDMESKLATARSNYEASPEDADAIIWLGRRLAYLGRYAEAIEVFTEGIEVYPEDARIYRHRGHRYITTRQLDRSITDLERAASLVAGREDQVEPDGLPNALGIPTSTLQSNIWYHLGLARYLGGDFTAALEAYRECLVVSRNPDMLVATSHWLYMTLRRLDRVDEAAELLASISPDMKIIENDDYHRLLMFYQGNLTAEDVLPDPADDLSSSTTGYGVGNWHLYNGRPQEAERVFRGILGGSGWAAFGYIAAEAEVSRVEN